MSEIFCFIVFLQMNVFMNQFSDICCSALGLQRMQAFSRRRSYKTDALCTGQLLNVGKYVPRKFIVLVQAVVPFLSP